MTNKNKTVFYTGITVNINQREYQHKLKTFDSFTKKYYVNKIVYYERLNTLEEAVSREKLIKAGSRAKKIALINSYNKEWKDLSENFWSLQIKQIVNYNIYQ